MWFSKGGGGYCVLGLFFSTLQKMLLSKEGNTHTSDSTHSYPLWNVDLASGGWFCNVLYVFCSWLVRLLLSRELGMLTATTKWQRQEVTAHHTAKQNVAQHTQILIYTCFSKVWKALSLYNFLSLETGKPALHARVHTSVVNLCFLLAVNDLRTLSIGLSLMRGIYALIRTIGMDCNKYSHCGFGLCTPGTQGSHSTHNTHIYWSYFKHRLVWTALQCLLNVLSSEQTNCSLVLCFSRVTAGCPNYLIQYNLFQQELWPK